MALEAAKVGQASLLASESGDLSLSGCDLKKFPDGIYLMLKNSQICSIDLSINAISTLSPKFFSTFQNMTHLNISNNNLHDLPEEASLLAQLKVLNFSDNKFTIFPDSIMKLPSLTLMDVSSNLIENVTLELFFFLPSLSEVDISNNPSLSDQQEFPAVSYYYQIENMIR